MRSSLNRPTRHISEGAFSFHRSMATMEAVVGPPVALFLLGMLSNDYRKIFWRLMIPSVSPVLLIIFFITEKEKGVATHADRPKLTFKRFDWRFKFFAAIAGLFAIGNSSDISLILRAQQKGIQTVMIPVVYLFFNLVYSPSAIPAGPSSTRAIWILFGFYGPFMCLTEGNKRRFSPR